MSLVLATTLQAGQSGNAAHNCFLAPDPSVPGQFKLKRGNAGGGTQDLLTIDPSGNVFVDVNPATGSRSKQILTTQKLADEFSSDLVEGGWQKLPTGLLLQWGRSSINTIANTNSSKSISFQVAFQFACFQAMTTPSNSNGIGIVLSSESESKTGFTLVAGSPQTSAAVNFRWLAIGI